MMHVAFFMLLELFYVLVIYILDFYHENYIPNCNPFLIFITDGYKIKILICYFCVKKVGKIKNESENILGFIKRKYRIFP